MKKPLFYFSLLLCSIFFWGCPYESRFPIDEPSVALHKPSLGKWISDEESSMPLGDFMVSKNGKLMYKITESLSKESLKERKEAGTPVDTYTGYVSMIGETPFLNLQKKGMDTWSLYKLSGYGSKVELIEVTSYIRQEFNSGLELKKFIAENMHKSYFFGDKLVFNKQ